MEKKNSFTHELIAGAVIYAFIIFAYVQTNSMLSDSALFPRMILGCMALLNTIMVIQAFIKKPRNKFTAREIGMPLLFFLGIIAYALLFRYIGYFPATGIMLVVLMLIMRVRPLWKILAITAGYLVFIYLLFVLWLNTNLI